MSERSETNVKIDRLVIGQHVIFEHNGRIFGGTVTDVSPGGYGRIVGMGFIAENVHPSICKAGRVSGSD